VKYEVWRVGNGVWGVELRWGAFYHEMHEKCTKNPPHNQNPVGEGFTPSRSNRTGKIKGEYIDCGTKKTQ